MSKTGVMISMIFSLLAISQVCQAYTFSEKRAEETESEEVMTLDEMFGELFSIFGELEPSVQKRDMKKKKETYKAINRFLAKKEETDNEFKLEHLGCWGDTEDRVFEIILDQGSVQDCAKKANDKGKSLFAVESGHCMLSEKSDVNYEKHGKKEDCVDGRGASWKMDVYKLPEKIEIPVKTTTTTSSSPVIVPVETSDSKSSTTEDVNEGEVKPSVQKPVTEKKEKRYYNALKRFMQKKDESNEGEEMTMEEFLAMMYAYKRK